MGASCVQGVQCRTLQGHAHWVNTLALSTDYVLRTGAFEPATATVNPQDLTGSREDLPGSPLTSDPHRKFSLSTACVLLLSGRSQGESAAAL